MNLFIRAVLVACVPCLFLVNCAQPIFYWGNYSQTLYRMKKTPDVEHREAHKKELLNIMEQSSSRKLQVPPGVYCEYGYLLFQEGRVDEALEYIALEEKLYPESATFTQRLKSSITGENPVAVTDQTDEYEQEPLTIE